MPFKEDNKNNNDDRQNERSEDDKLDSRPFTDSPEKKRQKQGSPQLNEDFPQCSTSQKITEIKNDGNNIPNWVAGSSPAKYLSLDELIKVHDSIEKMAIVHQIAVNPLCKVEDLRRQCPHSKLHETVKNDMQKAFWDLLRDDLSKNPPDMKNAFSLIVDLKNMITEHLESANLLNALSAVNEALDFEHLQNLFDKNALNLNEILGTILSVLERLCAPIRDELVIKLKTTEDTIELFKGIFELVELMKMDMANFALSQNRQLITSQSAKIEFEEFMKIYEMDKCKNCSERLENIAIQCCKHCEKEFSENFGWNEERSKMLKQQILNFVNSEEPVRKIAMTRICDFVRQVLKQSGDPLKIPSGMSTFQTELASFTSRYYAIVMHNWNTFGRFYAQILDEEFNKLLEKK
uniref:Uncharacterized protein n=1 Tax=Meloidogyne javanica TaxID=6303 RepID=A0A915MBV3_MELJA